ncbi:hypothetical protein, partial [Halobacterium bonnevillei]|uniref:hypothetical protein n=1 Tax=Halobacterium bonnevillei TaxID=2692200 RepID=UPI001F1E3685
VGDRARRAPRSLETGGTPLDIPPPGTGPSEVRCCLLVDVSGPSSIRSTGGRCWRSWTGSRRRR